MSANEEIEHHAHHAQEPFDKMVAGSMAVIAAFLAIVSVLGQHFNTEKLLTQQMASDQWAYYQAKDIRRYMAQVAGDLSQSKGDAAVFKKYAQDSDRYKKQSADIQDKARDFEKERDKLGRQADSFHVGEVFLELAIVLSSLSILFKNKSFFFGGLISALIGIGISIYGWLAYGAIARG